jgi:hypothetical protein
MSLVPASRVASRWFQISHVRLLLIIVPILLVLGFRSNVQVPGDSNLNDLATHAAAAIRTESKGSLGSTRVLVVDFSEMHDKPTELGRQLAEEFSASLSKQSHLVVDREESLRAVAEDRLLSGSIVHLLSRRPVFQGSLEGENPR